MSKYPVLAHSKDPNLTMLTDEEVSNFSKYNRLSNQITSHPSACQLNGYSCKAPFNPGAMQ